MADGSAKSAVLMSGKPGCFIAGADIRVRKGSFLCKVLLFRFRFFV